MDAVEFSLLSQEMRTDKKARVVAGEERVMPRAGESVVWRYTDASVVWHFYGASTVR